MIIDSWWKMYVCVCNVYVISHSPSGPFRTNVNKQWWINIQINITRLRISTGGRQTSWLFTSVVEKLNSGLPRTTSLAVRTGFEPGTYGFQIRRSNRTRPRCLPLKNAYDLYFSLLLITKRLGSVNRQWMVWRTIVEVFSSEKGGLSWKICDAGRLAEGCKSRTLVFT